MKPGAWPSCVQYLAYYLQYWKLQIIRLEWALSDNFRRKFSEVGVRNIGRRSSDFYNIQRADCTTKAGGYFTLFWQTCLHVTINTGGHAPTPCTPATWPPGTPKIYLLSQQQQPWSRSAEIILLLSSFYRIPRVERDRIMLHIKSKIFNLNLGMYFPVFPDSLR